MTDEKAVMLREIALQADFVRTNVDSMVDSASEALGTRTPSSIASGFTIGCGDSFSAALAMRAYMMATAQCWIEPVEALEFSRYLVESVTPSSIVFGVSNSGTVTRTIEGVRRARERGAATVAVTAGKRNELALTAATVVEVNAVPNIKRQRDGSKLVTPGTITYTASLLGLAVSAIALGECLTTRSAHRVRAAVATLRNHGDVMSAAESAFSPIVAEVARALTPDRRIIIVGGGPNQATSRYASAKFFEALSWPAHHAQIEEWAHEHYFLTGPTTDTIVIAAPGAARERALEQVLAAREMRSRTIVLGAANDAVAQGMADYYIPLPGEIDEMLTPFIYKLPFDYLTHALALRYQTHFFGFNDVQRQRVNFRQVFNETTR